MRSVRAVCRFFLLFLSCVLAVIVQSIVLGFTKGPASYIYPVFWHRSVLAIFGIRLEVTGLPVRGRQVIYVSNHFSYLDIPVLGSLVRGSLVSRGDIKDWPGWGFFGTLQQTVYISRRQTDTLKEKTGLDRMIEDGKNLIIFPEGTSSDGNGLLPFKSSLFSLAMGGDGRPPLAVQPITMALLEIDGHPVRGTGDRDLYAWHGDMTLPPHFWALARLRGARVAVHFHPPRDAGDFADRKALAAACRDDIAGDLQTRLAQTRLAPSAMVG